MNSQKAHETAFTIISHYRNAKQNHMKYHCTPTPMAKMQQTDDTHFDEDMKKPEYSYALRGWEKMATSLWEVAKKSLMNPSVLTQEKCKHM